MRYVNPKKTYVKGLSAKDYEVKNSILPPIDTEKQNVIDFCLNCTRPDCPGECKELRRFIKNEVS